MPIPVPPPQLPQQQPPPPSQPVARAEVANAEPLQETTWCYDDEPSEVMIRVTSSGATPGHCCLHHQLSASTICYTLRVYQGPCGSEESGI
ncbi:hypothetical protein Taro_009839 [Colocasia esculenta]|uniref:Uncharacterized protein n=1 Tax=Colocasia esculenta TaxID=4460 RepID=A0A843TXD9_COLES|nr:hypothetical protein [Colocasia esculenta]